jgi:hypothetical protein
LEALVVQDSKLGSLRGVWVRLPPPAHHETLAKASKKSAPSLPLLVFFAPRCVELPPLFRPVLVTLRQVGALAVVLNHPILP